MVSRALGSLQRLLQVGILVCCLASLQQTVSASPFGQGVFGAHVPFGSVTSMTIALGSNVSLTLSPSGPNFVGNGSHTITVTSTDVAGYNLYIYGAGGTNMSNGTDTIPASSNTSAGPLSGNTWGYNATGSTTNYIGLTTKPTLLKSAIGPYETGDNTTVTYGVLTDVTKSSGNYTVSVTYTVVATNE